MLTITTTRRIRELRGALKKLADACAQTLPGSAWSNEIDDALVRATYLVGPMDGEEEPTRWATRRRRQRDREDQAWSDGYHLGEDEVAEYIEGKDAFIAQQADLLVELVKGNHIRWEGLSEELADSLANYV